MYIYLAGFKDTHKNKKINNVPGLNGVAMRDLEVLIAGFCMEFRPGSNGTSPGHPNPKNPVNKYIHIYIYIYIYIYIPI